MLESFLEGFQLALRLDTFLMMSIGLALGIMVGALFALALWYFVLSFKLREGNLLKAVGAEGFVNVGVTLMCLLLYAFALPRLGFVASGAALIVVLSLFLGDRRHLETAAVAVLVPAGIYFRLTRLMRVSLPEFPFF